MQPTKVSQKSKGVESTPVEEEEKSSLFRYALNRDWIMMAVGTLGMAAGGAGMPAFSIIFGELIDGIYDPNPDKAGDKVQYMAIVFLLLGIVMWIVIGVGVGCWSIVAIRQTLAIRIKYIQALLKQDVGWFEMTGNQLVPTVLSDTNIIQEGLSDKFATALQFLSQFLVGMIIGFIHGWKLSLVILSIIPVLGVAGYFLIKLGDNKDNKKNAYASAGSIAFEYISGIRTVQAFSLQGRGEKEYLASLQHAKKKKLKTAAQSGFTLGFTFLGLFCAYALSLWYGSTLIMAKEENPETKEPWTGGDIVLVFFSVLIGGMGIGQAGPGLQSHKKALDMGKKIFQVIDRVPPIDVRQVGETQINFSDQITFSDVKFSYPSAPDRLVLKGVTFTVEPGKFVALVGPSGGGKSTVISLIERFYSPSSGSVKIGNHELSQIDLTELRSRIGLVSQEPCLFNLSIYENIKIGKPDATQEEIEEAAKAANAHDFILGLPEKYNTLVGEKGNQLSGGQKQRIAIARAIIRKPNILLLDEATSALDSTNEAIVQEALDRVMKGKTVIAIAHRLSTIKNADKIVVIGDGLVQETGTHDQLLSLGGVYAKLSSHQQMTTNDGKSKKNGKQARSSTLVTQVNESNLGNESEKKELDPEEIENAVPKELVASNKKRLKALMKSSWKHVIFGTLMAILNGVLMPLFSLIFTEMLKTFYKCIGVACADDSTVTCYGGFRDEERCFDDMRQESSLFSGLFAVLGFIGLVGNFGSVYSFSAVAQNMTIKIRQMVFHSILNQDIGFFDDPDNSTGSLTGRLEGDSEIINSVVAISTGINIQNLTSLTTGLVLAFIYGWQMALVLIGLVPLMAGAGMIQMKFISGKGRENSSKRESINKKIMESITLFRTITAFGAQDIVGDLVRKDLEDAAVPATKTAVIGGIAFGFSMFIMFAMYACSFSLGAYLIRTHQRTADEILKVFFALACAAIGMGNAAGVAPDGSKFKSASKAIFSLIDRVPLIDMNEVNGRKVRVTGKIEFENVSFAYPLRPTRPVVKSFSLNIEPRTKLAIVGPSGSGKSTSIRLLERFYEATEGILKIDGEGIKTLNLPHYRSQIGLVEQEPTLFTATVFENIRMGKPDATKEEVQAAAIQANAHGFIQSLANGYDTMIGTGHSQLSGGQKQRIAIARALIRNPQILLLDEATSALDSESEVLVNEVLKSSSVGRTTITIAHRLSTIKESDIIIVMENGVVVETGTHESLIEKGGLYASLVQQQDVGASDE
eukprot:c21313_g2_i2.p1 GENE.c21313_g2_i2~~c21313_g2_i2.p1  ORF type:complete len:1261 (-),score=558.88 c21313_g2_i2:339-4121(-)